MKNISFDNPWLLLIIIPLLLGIIIPFIISIKKDNKSKSVIASLIIHLIIAACVTLGVAGTIHTTVMTETNVYVVADISHSSAANLDLIDEYIDDIEKAMPRNSKLGVIAFGKDYQLLTEMGEKRVSVKEADVDSSATDIVSALNYAVSLFDDNVIKRVVLISDGRQTDQSAIGELVSVIDSMYSKDIYIDAIFLDNNIKEGTPEVQISDVDFTGSTYLNHKTTADVLVQSNTDTKAIISLYKGEERVVHEAITLTRGYNVVNLDMDTSSTGVFDYSVSIQMDGDVTEENNTYSFTQSIAGDVKVLFVSSSEADLATAERVYGSSAIIDSYVNDPFVPYQLEDLCKYDEIVLSNVDIRTLENFTAFIENIEKCVSVFGKSLVTVGDTKIQNSTDEVLMMLEDMLPVRFGNNDQDPKLYTLVIDTSRSMNDSYQLIMMKQAAVQILELLSDSDYISVISFSGEITVVQPPIAAANRDEVIETINAIEPTQGTVIGAALEKAQEFMLPLSFSEKQVMVISDGLSYALEADNPVDIARNMYENGIMVSTINTASQEGVEMLEDIAEAGGGSYYYLSRAEDVSQLILGDMANDITDSIIEGDTVVLIDKGTDSVLSGISTLPNISGYVFSKAKGSASTVISVSYRTSGGSNVIAPLYAYWDYGNGRVATFTTDLGGGWVSGWDNEVGDRFFGNLFETNVPAEKVDYPYTVNISYDGIISSIDIIPSLVDPFAKIDLIITAPNGETITEELSFNTEGYYYEFEPDELGKYSVALTYEIGGEVYSSTTYFNLGYSPEYDSFAVFDIASLEEVIRNRGNVFADSNITMVNDEDKIATYEIDYTVPLLIIAVILFVCDVIVRKVKWNDIASLFKKRAKKIEIKEEKI